MRAEQIIEKGFIAIFWVMIALLTVEYCTNSLERRINDLVDRRYGLSADITSITGRTELYRECDLKSCDSGSECLGSKVKVHEFRVNVIDFVTYEAVINYEHREIIRKLQLACAPHNRGE